VKEALLPKKAAVPKKASVPKVKKEKVAKN